MMGFRGPPTLTCFKESWGTELSFPECSCRRSLTELDKFGLYSGVGYTTEKSAGFHTRFWCCCTSTICTCGGINIHTHICWAEHLVLVLLSSLLPWGKAAFAYEPVSFKCFSSQQLSKILKKPFFSNLTLWSIYMTLWSYVLHVLSPLPCPKLYMKLPPRFPFSWCLLPSKDHFFQYFRKATTVKVTGSVLLSGLSATQPRAASEEGNLGEGWWYREGRQSQPRQKKQRNLFLDLLLLLFSCLYITTLRNKVLGRCALEPHRQLWGWGDFVAGSCANSSNWQV